MCILTRANKFEKGRPLSHAKAQINLDTDAMVLKVATNIISSITITRKLMACLFLVIWWKTSRIGSPVVVCVTRSRSPRVYIKQIINAISVTALKILAIIML
jgi:hypothetical protein